MEKAVESTFNGSQKSQNSDNTEKVVFKKMVFLCFREY